MKVATAKRPVRSRPGPVSSGEARSPQPHTLGVLAVGGAGALRAEVIIDGERRGYAPRLIELPLGEHVLELVTPEGRRVGPERIQLTELHTQVSPLRWVVPEERAPKQAAAGE
jgi:hypothetical protein